MTLQKLQKALKRYDLASDKTAALVSVDMSLDVRFVVSESKRGAR